MSVPAFPIAAIVAPVRKALPTDHSFRALFGPRREYAYFSGAPVHPFRFEAPAFAPVNATWLADAALLAYVPEHDFVRAAWARAGFRDVAFFENDGTCAFGAACDGAAIVAFRGTDEAGRFPQNLRVLLAPEGDRGRVHEGYQDALDAVWERLDTWLAGRPAAFCGHSLGAGLALVATGRHPRARMVYTFGSPRVGDRQFRDELGVPAFRFVNNNDIVTRVPPALGYHHVGELKYFAADGTLHDGPDLWDRLRFQVEGHLDQLVAALRQWREGDWKALAYDPLVDHSPLLYAVLTWNHFVATLQTPGSA